MPTRKDGTSKYTSKQERKAEHIEEGYKKSGVSADEAEKRAWATVNKQTGGAAKKKTSRKKSSKKKSSKKTSKKKASKKKKTSRK